MEPTQAVTTIIGAVGGLGGITALLGHVFQRRKMRAEAADVLTDTALTLVEPLQQRVKEVDREAREARQEARQAREEMAEVRASLTELIALLRRWRSAVLSPHVSREMLVEMVRAEHMPSSNGRTDSGA